MKESITWIKNKISRHPFSFWIAVSGSLLVFMTLILGNKILYLILSLPILGILYSVYIAKILGRSKYWSILCLTLYPALYFAGKYGISLNGNSSQLLLTIIILSGLGVFPLSIVGEKNTDFNMILLKYFGGFYIIISLFFLLMPTGVRLYSWLIFTMAYTVYIAHLKGKSIYWGLLPVIGLMALSVEEKKKKL